MEVYLIMTEKTF